LANYLKFVLSPGLLGLTNEHSQNGGLLADSAWSHCRSADDEICLHRKKKRMGFGEVQKKMRQDEQWSARVRW